ncbi:hypothetical protein PENSPDRAFT_688502 [Peniophora sp. CONT]|nr:hypothetical protein PENSPDRAFT_688502 [Peniophora sp. CONT]
MFTTDSLSWAWLIWLSSLIAVAEATTNYTTCLEKVRNGTFLLNYTNGGALDSYGHNASDITQATTIPYRLCWKECGTGPEAFNWTIFSTNFSTWLLPWLALVSQLPFGSQLRQQNALSAFLTVGSPALAAYSLIICVLNWSWVPRAFEGIRYPNVEYAWRVLGSLQHSPLHIEHEMLASLVALPENGQWWECLAVGLDYESTWTAAIVIQIAWVAIAFILTVVDSFQDGITNDFQSSGRGTGTLFLWLLPLVIGWQRLSPRCDFSRVRDALQRANESVYYIPDRPEQANAALYSPYSSPESVSFPSPQITNPNLSPPTTRAPKPIVSIPALRNCRDRFAFALFYSDDDRGASAPIYSDTRLLPWTANVELVAGAFRVAAEVMAVQDVDPHDEQARRRFFSEVSRRIQQRRSLQPDWNTIVRRCIKAGVLAMVLHWGAIGSAIVYSFFTFTSGLGCRSGSFLLYAVVGTVVWIIIVSSSFINHYAEWLEHQQRLAPRSDLSSYHLSPRSARGLAKALRGSGKVLAIANAIFIVTACIFLFSNFYTRCWCDSSVLGRGATHAYNVIAPTPGDADQLKIAWIGAIILSLGSVLIFVGFVYMHVEPVSPDPSSLQSDQLSAFATGGYFPVEHHVYGSKRPVHDHDPYTPDIVTYSPEGFAFTPSSSSHSREEISP